MWKDADFPAIYQAAKLLDAGEKPREAAKRTGAPRAGTEQLALSVGTEGGDPRPHRAALRVVMEYVLRSKMRGVDASARQIRRACRAKSKGEIEGHLAQLKRTGSLPGYQDPGDQGDPEDPPPHERPFRSNTSDTWAAYRLAKLFDQGMTEEEAIEKKVLPDEQVRTMFKLMRKFPPASETEPTHAESVIMYHMTMAQAAGEPTTTDAIQKACRVENPQEIPKVMESLRKKGMVGSGPG